MVTKTTIIVGTVAVLGLGYLISQAAATPSTGSTTGSLNISSSPQGAEISLDGVDQGAATPYIITAITTGTHNVKLSLSGYQDWTGTVTILAGQTTFIIPTLITAAAGTLDIISCPANVNPSLDGSVSISVTVQALNDNVLNYLQIVAGSYTDSKLVILGINETTTVVFMIPAAKVTATMPYTVTVI